MKEKISMKTIYLIGVIATGLTFLAVGSTYAMFTASATIDNPISFSSSLAYGSEIIESADVTVASHETKTVTLNVNNNFASSIKYASWYINDSSDIEIVAEPASGYSLSGSLASNTSFAIRVTIRNNGSTSKDVNLGVSSTTSSDNITLSNGMKLLSEGSLPTAFFDFDYYLGSESTTVNSVNYYSSTYDNTYNISIDPITISSNEVLLAQYKGTDPNVTVPNTYTVDGTTYNTVILASAYISYINSDVDIDTDTGIFMENTLIKNVTFGDNIRSVSTYGEKSLNSLFFSCSSLTTVNNLPKNVVDMTSVFDGCTSLTKAPTIPNQVTNMDYTFEGCSKLTTAPAIPNSVTNMTSTFKNCSKLTTAPTIPSNVTSLSSTFEGCTSLTTAPQLPSSITSLVSTFKGCTSLTTVPEIPSSVTNMNSTFTACTSLTKAPTIPNQVTNMDYTFEGCSKLTTAPAIPSTVTSMNATFNFCSSLGGSVYILAENVTNVTHIFSNTSNPIGVYTRNGSTTNTNLKNLTASNGKPSNVTIY